MEEHHRICGGMHLPAPSQVHVCCPFYISQDHLPKGGTTHSKLGLSTAINSQEEATQTCPQGNLVEAISQLRVLSHRQL